MVKLKETADFQRLSERLIAKAGEILLRYKSKFRIKKQKGFLDIATTADYASEKYLIDTLRKYFPGHNILSEETADLQKQKSPYQWIIDPLDGTKEYVRNHPNYSVNLALEYEKKLILGVMYQPEINRLYSTSSGSGVKVNKTITKISSETDLKKAIIYTHLPDYRITKKFLFPYLKIISNLILNCYRVRSNAHDCESLAFVAIGAAEGFILPNFRNLCLPKWWDVAAGILMVQKAGGVVTDFLGKPVVNRDLTHGLVASNGKIHQQLLELIKY